MKSLLRFVLITVYFLSFALNSAYAEDKVNPKLQTLIQDFEVKKKIEAKQNEEALNIYFKMLESNSDLPEIHSNIGVLFLLNKKNEEALKSLQKALKLAEENKDLATQFKIRYNLGVLFGLDKKVPEALENYQAALDIVPDSKETKTNIELLIQSDSKDQSKSGENKDKKDSKDQKDKDEKKDDKGDSKDDKKDSKDQKDKDDKKDEEQKKNEPKEAKQNAKYKPRPFKGDQLAEGDVKKILGELTNQEQKIRANFEKKERKEKKNEKDW
ncbi:MAG: tetratricopeptide repeat protein [Pseudobdellovibrio sp.]